MATQEDLEKFATRVTRPGDFEEFWKDVMEELAQVPLEANITPDPLRSTEDVRVSKATYRSLDASVACQEFPARRKEFPPPLRFRPILRTHRLAKTG